MDVAAPTAQPESTVVSRSFDEALTRYEPIFAGRPGHVPTQAIDWDNYRDLLEAVTSGTPIIASFAGGVLTLSGVASIGNSADPALLPHATRLLDHDSPLVRGMAVWALRQLLDGPAFERLKSVQAARERDASVREEWDA